MTKRAQAIIGCFVIGLARSAMACDCLTSGGYSDKDVANVLAKADAVVHAKVVGLTGHREARIMIYESFKGQPSILKAQSIDQGDCGTSFQAGEEGIYIVYSGEVGLCGKLPVEPDLVRRFRAYRR